jgi:hypothetical protein
LRTEETNNGQAKAIQQQETKLESAEEHETLEDEEEEEEEEEREEADSDTGSQVGEESRNTLTPSSAPSGTSSAAVTVRAMGGSRARRGGPLLTLQHMATVLHEPELIRRMG